MENKIGVHRDTYIGIGMILFSIAVFVYCRTIPGEASYLPSALAVFMGLMGAIVLVKGVRFTKAAGISGKPHEYKIKGHEMVIPLIVFGMIATYIILFQWLGYYVATLLFLIAVLRYLKAGSWKLTLMISLGYVIGCFVVFSVLLRIPIYRIGILGPLFKL